MDQAKKPRGRDLGLPFPGTPGPQNAITDVAGVAVGFATLKSDGPPQVRTGVTAIIPRSTDRDLSPVWAGFHALNGNGEMTGTHWIEEAGYFCGPVLITNTHSVGIVHHAAVRWMTGRYRLQFDAMHLWAMPVIAETYDGVLSDINGQHVTEAMALSALDEAARGPLPEGSVGGGTGMVAYGFKGGTGTASRRLELEGGSGTIAALVQANHGVREWLTVLGVPVGRHIPDAPLFRRETGSIIAIFATDLPLSPLQLRRVAKRASIGIGRGGTPGGNNSGDIFLAFSVANPVPLPQSGPATSQVTLLNDELLDPVFQASVEAVEEAVVNALLAGEDTPTFRPPDRIVPALRPEVLLDLARSYGRLPASGEAEQRQ
ncbi:P1 family peptidase [Mesorhizobium australicum]|uniref:L-aminopeptidase DmpA. Serine peptidase. MEROPS family S58 n=1 Tax=Mesorhizobium australicum TaxID=536018 RepID=A0A1X7MRA7_9HYPH|nr:P1 family peptidase [Mesorhizobium australicum]SMH26503.1 L-aminopeptidase DmpA. Serine peptidase. MEROPS family S58 [Mesorhizobium australicum]